jgi:tetratricopeptide (TPR) repeat protein
VPGEPWQEALEEALDQCRTFAVFVGPNTISPWENEEMRSALETRVHDRERRVIPVLLPGALDSRDLKLPRFLSRLTWVDFRSGMDDKNALDRLYAGIQGIKPGAGRTDDENKTKISISPKLTTFFLRFQRKRYLWMLLIGIAVLVLLLLALNGNIDAPLFCGKKYQSAAGYIDLAIKQRDLGSNRSACALQNLHYGLEANPSSVEQSHIYYLFATVYLNRQDTLNALKYADLGLNLDAGDEYAHLLHASKGFAYCQLRQNAEASAEFKAFIENRPEGVGTLVDTVKGIISDLESGKDVSGICWVDGTSLP